MKQILILCLCMVTAICTAQTVGPSSKVPHTFFSTLLPISYDKAHQHRVIQLGGYWGTQGKAQPIAIEELVGNQYTLTPHQSSNGLIGLGYFIEGPDTPHFQMNYGVNGFYLAPTAINGTIIVEQYVTDLSYHYKTQSTPVYFSAKALIKNEPQRYQFTMDAGIGANFIRAFDYKESPIYSDAVPQNNFSAHTQGVFTAMAGIGLRFNRVFGLAPLECGYRFFYLGQGQLQINNSLYQNTLKTGNTYANALMCAVTV